MKKNNPKKNEPQIGDQYQIPKEGSLGLMGLGYRGLMMWRSKLLDKPYDGQSLIGPIVQGKNLKIYTTGSNTQNEEK